MKNLFLYSMLSLGALTLGAQAAPVGMIAQVKGSVTTSRGGKTIPARLLGRLEPGTVVNVGANSSAVVVLFGKTGRYKIAGDSKATISPNGVGGIKPTSDLSGASANATKILGDARVGAIGSFNPSPTQQERLQPDLPPYLSNSKPRFSWPAIPDAIRYTFTLFDAFDNVVWATSTNKTEVDYPADLPPLHEKEPYLWRLTAFKGTAKPDNKSRFGFVTVLSVAQATELNTAVAGLKAQADKEKEDKTAQLMLVETYRSFGMINSALELLEDLILEDKNNEFGFVGAREEVLDSLSPFARVLAGRPVEAPKTKKDQESQVEEAKEAELETGPTL